MAMTKLKCPECSKVLRPKNPVSPGKKVRCPDCETVFVASEEDEFDEVEEEERPRKSAKKKAAPTQKKAAAPAKKASGGDDEEGAYGLAGDPNEEDENKPKISYAPDMSIKDLRGPAVKKLMPSTNALTFSGFIGVGGALVLLVLLAFPALLPISPDTSPNNERPQAGQEEKKKAPGPKVIWYKVWGINFAAMTEHAGWFLLWALLFIAMGVYSAIVCVGAIKAQNLESRGWGIAGSIMAMLPINTFCAMMALGILIRCAILMILDDDDFIDWLYIGLGSILYLISLLSGVWAIVTLNDEEVIAGYEYEGE